MNKIIYITDLYHLCFMHSKKLKFLKFLLFLNSIISTIRNKEGRNMQYNINKFFCIKQKIYLSYTIFRFHNENSKTLMKFLKSILR